MSHEDATRQRFAATAGRLAEQAATRREALERRLRHLLALRGDERALDVGTGTGAVALALAPLVAEVVGVDAVPEMLAEARAAASGVENAGFVEGDARALPFQTGEFDLAACVRTLHHLPQPGRAIAELGRVTRPGGRVLVVDQIASVDPLEALAHNRLERLRDPSHVRVLADQDLRAFFDANWLALRSAEFEPEERDLDEFLALAGCEGDARQAVLDEVERLLARGQRAGIDLRRAGDGYGLTLTIGWYVLERREAPTTAI